jgi:hypothetical protein
MAWDMVRKDLLLLEAEVRGILQSLHRDEGAVLQGNAPVKAGLPSSRTTSFGRPALQVIASSLARQYGPCEQPCDLTQRIARLVGAREME